MKAKSSAVKINGNLSMQLDLYLESTHAKSMGYSSKQQFVTEAVRNHLVETVIKPTIEELRLK